MHPLLTFASGLLAGIVGVRLINKAAPSAAARLDGIGDKARQGLCQAQGGLRDATVSGLTAIEKSSASLRAKLVSAVPGEAAPPAKAAKPRAPRKAPARKAKAAAPAPAEGGTAS
ncbi:hypothetical protein H261_15300 [Paramagnetospirillum caucaseum]|uniref:Uncharacterized protein n=1 Tax=Paramagnetospirillum caucaseum TaxID=1244869 RepID=M3A970_9PROT|nr:hypothetical protein [Paramagnetospirillum caucaseum]EME69039.1 hypothetical protein H261_15300 [Paramagnetospirillum caucaseum]